MIFWIIVAAIIICASIICFYFLYRNENLFGCFLGGIFGIGLVLVILLSILGSYFSYIQFEKTFDIQKTQYEQIAKTEKISDYVFVIEALDVNKELARLQASKETYGILSTIPNRVFNIEPIGIE